MSIDILSNPATAGSNNDEREKRGIGSYLGDLLYSGLDTWLSAIGTGVNAAKGIGKYIYDTATAESNSVPYRVRLAVAGARKAEDKLKTLRQFYPDAMPTDDGDFTFIDPKTNKRITLNDPGLSAGDIVGSIPDIGEVAGGALGAIGGSAAGTSFGPPGVIAGGIGGAGIGAAAGQEGARQFAQILGSLLTGKDTIDTRSGADIGYDALKTSGLNSAFAAVPFAGRAIRNSQVGKYLTDKSADLYKSLAGKGYDPTLSQIGSDAGKELNDRLIANKIIGPELHNQEVLQGRIDKLLGPDIAGLDKNALANKLRAESQEAIAKKYGISKEAYENLHYSDEIINPATESRATIQDIYKKRGMQVDDKGNLYLPKNKKPNSDFSFEPKIQDKMDDIMNGKATEAELFAFEKDLTSSIYNKDLPFRSKQSLIMLRDTIRKDLANAPGLGDQARAARAAHYEYKDSQEKLETLLGKAEGVTEGTNVGSGEGLTAAQNLDRANRAFLNSSMGDDQKAAILANQLSPASKKISLGSILQEDRSARGFENPIEKATQRYNMERVGKNLVAPEDKQMFSELLSEAEGTRAIPPGYLDRTGLLNTDATTIGLAGAIDPTLGGATAIGLNAVRGAPLAAGGTGGTITSLLKNNALMTKINQIRSNVARGAAKAGEFPSNLSYQMSSPVTIPATMAIGQGTLGNLSNGPESNLQIPMSTINQAVPEESLQKIEPQKSGVNLDDLLKDDGKAPQINLDDLLSDEPPTRTNQNMQNTGPAPVNSGNYQKINLNQFMGSKGATDINKNNGGENARISLDEYMKYRSGNTQNSNTSGLLAQVKDAAMRTFPDNPTMQKVAIAQAILESGLTGNPSQLAINNKNLFGIKEGGTAPGTAQAVSYKTQEYRGGSAGNENARFSANNTYEDSLNQYKNLLENLPRYSRVINSSDPTQAFIELQRAGYATDPQYARKLIRIYNKSVAPLFTEI